MSEVGQFRRANSTFQVDVDLDDLPYQQGDDFRPRSLEPVIFTNDDGERQIELMRRDFKLPDIR